MYTTKCIRYILEEAAKRRLYLEWVAAEKNNSEHLEKKQEFSCYGLNRSWLGIKTISFGFVQWAWLLTCKTLPSEECRDKEMWLIDNDKHRFW